MQELLYLLQSHTGTCDALTESEGKVPMRAGCNPTDFAEPTKIAFCSTELVFEKRPNVYIYIYIFGQAGPESGPASPRHEENRRGASWRISGASQRITTHHDAPRFTLDTICSIPFSFPRVGMCRMHAKPYMKPSRLPLEA